VRCSERRIHADERPQAEIEKQIPRIVSLLGTADARDVVRTAFASVLQKMTPADLLVALHSEDTVLIARIEGKFMHVE
jgi:symplekin